MSRSEQDWDNQRSLAIQARTDMREAINSIENIMPWGEVDSELIVSVVNRLDESVVNINTLIGYLTTGNEEDSSSEMVLPENKTPDPWEMLLTLYTDARESHFRRYGEKAQITAVWSQAERSLKMRGLVDV